MTSILEYIFPDVFGIIMKYKAVDETTTIDNKIRSNILLSRKLEKKHEL